MENQNDQLGLIKAPSLFQPEFLAILIEENHDKEIAVIRTKLLAGHEVYIPIPLPIIFPPIDSLETHLNTLKELKLSQHLVIMNDIKEILKILVKQRSLHINFKYLSGVNKKKYVTIIAT